MPRPFKCRNIFSEPGITAFKPTGIPANELEIIELRLDEVEAIRLADLEGMYHEEAAKRMGISRATFGRLVQGARQKVADALLQGKMLTFKGGKVVISGGRAFLCSDCGQTFEISKEVQIPEKCPSCFSANFVQTDQRRGWGRNCGRGRRGHGRR